MEETPNYNLQVQFTLSLKSTFSYQLYYIYNYVLKVGWQRDHNLKKLMIYTGYYIYYRDADFLLLYFTPFGSVRMHFFL